MRSSYPVPAFVAALFVATLVSPISPVAAQAPQPRIAGVWVVRYERLMQSMHDSEGHIVSETARMTLRVRGDSVFGSWEPASDPGEPSRAPSSVRGVVRGDSVHAQLDAPPPDDDGFFSEMGREIVQFLKTYVHGMPPMTPRFDVLARGDSLIGLNGSVSLDGTKKTLPRPFLATRETR
jgi:hypothetical protein